MVLLIRPFYSQISDRAMEGLTGLSPWYKQLYLQKFIRYSFSGLQKLIKKQNRTFSKRLKANATGYCTNSWETLAIWSGHRDHFTPHKSSVAENNTPLQDRSQKEKTCHHHAYFWQQLYFSTGVSYFLFKLIQLGLAELEIHWADRQ